MGVILLNNHATQDAVCAMLTTVHLSDLAKLQKNVSAASTPTRRTDHGDEGRRAQAA